MFCKNTISFIIQMQLMMVTGHIDNQKRRNNVNTQFF